MLATFKDSIGNIVIVNSAQVTHFGSDGGTGTKINFDHENYIYVRDSVNDVTTKILATLRP